LGASDARRVGCFFASLEILGLLPKKLLTMEEELLVAQPLVVGCVAWHDSMASDDLLYPPKSFRRDANLNTLE
jgi:hypothetical protein